MENKIYFLGNSKDFDLAQRLCNLICKDLSLDKKVAVLGKGVEAKEKYNAVAYEYGTDVSPNIADKTYTYSVGQSNADICGFNFQKREVSRSLELLSGSLMGRVNIPVNSEFTEAAVLYCGAGLLAEGFALTEILKAINSKIS